MAAVVELPPIRPRIKAQVARFLGIARSSEEQLFDAFVLVAERHERHYDVQRGATMLAGWSRENLDSLVPLEKKYGSIPSDQPERLRSALLGGTRVGSIGTLQDLQDLSLLAEQVSMAWLMLQQGAKELHDDELLEVSGRAKEHTRRQLAWLRTMIEHDAPEPLAVAMDPASELAASRPKRLSALSSIPDSIWAPLSSGLLLLIVGVAGLLVGRPWLLPSLGPTAVLQTENSAHPTSRAWNVIAGHLGGLVAGFIGVLLFQASDAPVVLVAKQLAPERVGASVVAIALTVLFGVLLRASHPPAAATTLLVSLGSIATLVDALNLVAGVVIIAIVGELVRRARLGRTAPAERMAPNLSIVRQALRR
jgi:HPP family